MRLTLAALCLGTALATPALGDTIEARAQIAAVTLFPHGAQVVRKVSVQAGDGTHELLVPDLPKGTDISSLRVSGDGVRVGAVRLIDGRAPAMQENAAPQIAAARTALEDAQAALAAQQDNVAAIKAKAQAAQAEIDWLKSTQSQVSDPAQVQALGQAIGAQILAASQRAIEAGAEARKAETGLTPFKKAVDQAQKALEALQNPADAGEVLQAQVSGAGTITITTYAGDAGWQPSYDLRLDQAQDQLEIDRFVSVHQATGEDWRGVDLTLSTAQPGGQSAPPEVPPRRVRIGPPDVPVPVARTLSMAKGAPEAAMAEPMPADRAVLQMQDQTVTYQYPSKVDLRDGVDDLRLSLDSKTIPVDVLAEAVPLYDPQAFLLAEGKNATGEILLPGPATLFSDGALVGQSHLDLTPAGDKLSLGFGPIEGIRVTRKMPDTMEGDTGLISKSDTRREVVEIEIRNLTDRNWPVRVVDRVPYSEQEDLQVKPVATPAPSEMDYNDHRGVWAWNFDLGAGQDKTIRSVTTLSWPKGQVLR